MNSSLNLWIVLLFLGFAQGIFLSAVLFFNPRTSSGPNKVLAALMMSFSLIIGEQILVYSQIHLQFPHIYRTTIALPLLIGPLFLFYAKSLTDNSFELKKENYLHLLPFGLLMLYLIPYYLSPGEMKLQLYYGPTTPP